MGLSIRLAEYDFLLFILNNINGYVNEIRKRKIVKTVWVQERYGAW